jgi:hypothetical protein
MHQGWIKALVCGVGLASVGLTGCQVHLGGQMLPSPYYLTDDVQYFAPGPEFNLSREAAAQKAYKAGAGAAAPAVAAPAAVPAAAPVQ